VVQGVRGGGELLKGSKEERDKACGKQGRKYSHWLALGFVRCWALIVGCIVGCLYDV